jgi:hypothetical protein
VQIENSIEIKKWDEQNSFKKGVDIVIINCYNNICRKTWKDGRVGLRHRS